MAPSDSQLSLLAPAGLWLAALGVAEHPHEAVAAQLLDLFSASASYAAFTALCSNPNLDSKLL